MATFTVSTTNDIVDGNYSQGQLSLREAVNIANATARADTILFAPAIEGQTLTLTGGELVLRQDVSIDGDQNNDDTGVTLSGGDAQRILRTSGTGTDVSLADITLTDGRYEGTAPGGGGICAGAGTGVTVSGSTVRDCFAEDGGGGIFAENDSRLVVVDSTMQGNYNYRGGGAISGQRLAEVVVRHSTFSDNGSFGDGGGGAISASLLTVADSILSNNNGSYNGGGAIEIRYGTATILRSSLISNSSFFGGAISTSNSDVSVQDSTIANNHAHGGYYGAAGGGIEAFGGTLVITNSTVTGNLVEGNSEDIGEDGIPMSGGGIYTNGVDLSILNSTVAGNAIRDSAGGPTYGPDIFGSLTFSNGHNIFGTDVAGNIAGDREEVSPVLLFAAIDPTTGGGLLADNGGPTPTVALWDDPANPAIGGADPADAGATDQRGVALPQPKGSTPDIGAFELAQSFAPPENFVPTKPFDGLEYIASYPDLMRAFGPNEAAGVAHYKLAGSAEGREVSFDGLEYIASYADLVRAFGTDRDAGSTHFISSGFLEARTTSFNAFEYIATYEDLINAFGVNQAAGSTHYLTFGLGEGRSVQFDGLEYIAGYRDLRAAFGVDEDAGAAHYIAAGHDEHRTIRFDGLQYIASHKDLIHAFGADVDAGSRHFILYGANEHRSPDDFDEQQYLANYPDLQAAFGNDTEAATRHFITNGSAEGRTDDPLSAATDFLL